ncbi:mCG131812 [Mus musculus]|nr:mCG131812 [Mus musculus]
MTLTNWFFFFFFFFPKAWALSEQTRG